MKKLIDFRRIIKVILILTVVAVVQSCVVYTNPYGQQKVSVQDIVQMSKDGQSSKNIINDIRHSRSTYALKADQLARLRDEGVSDSVINYMEKTHFDYMNRNSYPYYGWDDGYGYYGGGYYGGWGFGWPYYGWGWGFGPSIIVRNYGGFHGGYHGGFHGGGHFRR